MDTTTILVLIGFGLLTFIVGGIGLRSFMINKYDYNVFSILNIALSFLGTCAIGITIWFYIGTQFQMSARIGMTAFTSSIYLLLFFVISKKSTWYMGLISVLYLLLSNILLILLLLFLSMMPGSGNWLKKKRAY